ncbi:MAG: RNA polymerase subunit sigma-70 [Henriciella sp.]|uniref:sigma-70 family RNA polymerase sigma factor n=1 Tax=Henriciella sp. TaxID=1968823 RepID=UPI000C12075C|nr:sigma-70 family RNA polymerase sigma factor [Henriciella sp.]MAN74419.1 RNA polymerase subunit sigma-70 [Henriciella sp.]MBF35197.1 RNA polymerase subunit sigma-70 [Hyphomonadaceae bacterium]MBK75160.1 RNA polymerase subunit sigma-70 [Henriciella sp.]PHR72591.1 MAG: RNA polymerase subunit sigma-70 [Henriciella sp.]
MTQPTLDDQAFKTELAGLIPHLRAFARSLCGNATAADDLAQEAMLKAWKARESYQSGTNLKAWTFTILRNLFYSEKRRSWRRQQLDPEVAEATLVSNDDPSSALDLLALRTGLTVLPEDQREALILVGAGGLSYEETAEICGCAVGTIKSRVSRARKALAEIIENSSGGYAGDGKLRASEAFDDIMKQADELSSGSSADV